MYMYNWEHIISRARSCFGYFHTLPAWITEGPQVLTMTYLLLRPEDRKTQFGEALARLFYRRVHLN